MLNYRELRGLSEEDRLTLATIQNERTRHLASAYLQAESDGERLAILASLAKEAARMREEAAPIRQAENLMSGYVVPDYCADVDDMCCSCTYQGARCCNCKYG